MGSGAHPASCKIGTGISSPRNKAAKARGLSLDPPLAKIRMSGPIPPFPHMPSRYAHGQLYRLSLTWISLLLQYQLMCSWEQNRFRFLQHICTQRRPDKIALTKNIHRLIGKGPNQIYLTVQYLRISTIPIHYIYLTSIINIIIPCKKTFHPEQDISIYNAISLPLHQKLPHFFLHDLPTYIQFCTKICRILPILRGLEF